MLRGTMGDDFCPAYCRIAEGLLEEKAGKIQEILRDCTLCPRLCHVDRTAGELGFCRTGDLPFVSSSGPHYGEERPLVGTGGSGTIFFGRCNLGCLFCQNYPISHLGEGIDVSHERLAGLMLSLQDAGCHNINLVSPTHQSAAILRAVVIARKQGLDLPIVYNCGGYESIETLRILEGVIDIYMPDIKYAAPAHGARYSEAADYPEIAMAALREMHRQVGDLVMGNDGVAQRGLLVRHLVLPGGIAGTAEVVRFIAREVSPNTYLNIMDQYHPCYKAFEHPPLDRRLSRMEYEEALALARAAGIRRIDGVTI